MEKLVATLPRLQSVIQRLQYSAHPDIIAELQKVYETVIAETAEYCKKKDAEFDKNADLLDAIAKDNNFNTVWSTRVTAKDIKKKMPYRMESLSYQGHTIKISKFITWLEAWKAADVLVRKSGDTHHIFIESFYEESPGKYSLGTGS